MSHIEQVEKSISEQNSWSARRKLGIPNNKKLLVLACMDERLPVEEALGLAPGDAHVFRNAGGFATDDAIRSAALSIHFFGTEEIIIVNHTDCGMLSATGAEVSSQIEEKTGLDLTKVALDPGLEDVTLTSGQVDRWWKMQPDIDAANQAQIEALRSHPLIPDNIAITGYVFEVETGTLRRALGSKSD
jgi:carbonic anhydrase